MEYSKSNAYRNIYGHYLCIHKGCEDSGDEISIATYVVAELLTHFQVDYQPYCYNNRTFLVI